jgi:hypothetical protein
MTRAATRRRTTTTPSPTVAKSGRYPATQRTSTDARKWLRENGYEDVAALIDEVMNEWAASGARTRRDWWVTLAGGVDGKPATVNGREFPVLACAQRRQSKPVTKNAIRRNARETPPPIRDTGRWS